MKRRNFVVAGGLGLLAATQTISTHARSTRKVRPTLIHEITFLKALSEQKQALAQFIRKNWFAIDAIATKQGLMNSYQLFENQNTDDEWDLLVMVGYPQADGYAGIREQFEAIRAKHVTIPVGASLPQLGRIVGSERWKELANNA